MAAELREAGGRAAAGPAVEEAPRRQRVRGPGQGRRPAAGGRGGAGRGRRGRRPERRAADRVAGLDAVPHRAPQVERPGGRDRAGADEGRGVRGPGAVEGTPPRGGAVPRARRRPRDRDARPGLRLVPAPAQPHPRARRSCARPRRSSTPTPRQTTGRTCPTTSGPRGWRAAARPARRRARMRPTPPIRRRARRDATPLPRSPAPTPTRRGARTPASLADHRATRLLARVGEPSPRVAPGAGRRATPRGSGARPSRTSSSPGSGRGRPCWTSPAGSSCARWWSGGAFDHAAAVLARWSVAGHARRRGASPGRATTARCGR